MDTHHTNTIMMTQRYKHWAYWHSAYWHSAYWHSAYWHLAYWQSVNWCTQYNNIQHNNIYNDTYCIMPLSIIAQFFCSQCYLCCMTVSHLAQKAYFNQPFGLSVVMLSMTLYVIMLSIFLFSPQIKLFFISTLSLWDLVSGP